MISHYLFTCNLNSKQNILITYNTVRNRVFICWTIINYIFYDAAFLEGFLGMFIFILKTIFQ